MNLVQNRKRLLESLIDVHLTSTYYTPKHLNAGRVELLMATVTTTGLTTSCIPASTHEQVC